MNKKIFAFSLLAVFGLLSFPALSNASCALVSGKTYYTDGVSHFRDSACHQEMTAADLNAGTATASTETGSVSTGNGNCRYSLAKKQYTDGVSFFTDNKCSSEALNDDAVAAPNVSTAAAPMQTASVATASATNERIAALEKKVDVLMSIMTQILALLAKK